MAVISDSNSADNSKKYLAGLSLAAIGIVYGDIGTSPLYAFCESFHDEYGLAVFSGNVLGVRPLIFWALIPKQPEMYKWRDHLFSVIVRNQQQPTMYFNLPPNRVVEMSAQVKL